jgi:hypothetical protein
MCQYNMRRYSTGACLPSRRINFFISIYPGHLLEVDDLSPGKNRDIRLKVIFLNNNLINPNINNKNRNDLIRLVCLYKNVIVSDVFHSFFILHKPTLMHLNAFSNWENVILTGVDVFFFEK